MKKTLKVSLLALFISNGAFATQYALNSEYLAVSFNDANSAMVLKDVKSQHQLSPEELFFLTLPDETVIHAADFKIKHVDKKDNAIIIDYAHPYFNIMVKLNLVKDKYVSIDYTIAAVDKAREVAKITFFPTRKQSQAPWVEGSINSSPIIADSF